MPSEAVLWLIAGIVLIGVELFTSTFVLVMLGGGALSAALASALGAPVVAQLLVFAAVSVALLGVARPALRRRAHTAPLENGHNPVGSRGLVTARVDRDGGQIRIGGDLWSARALDERRSFEPGDRVTVLELSGVTAVVGDDL
jgi:membrane protein implicated in regulation of membrane protease activity